MVKLLLDHGAIPDSHPSQMPYYYLHVVSDTALFLENVFNEDRYEKKGEEINNEKAKKTEEKFSSTFEKLTV